MSDVDQDEIHPSGEQQAEDQWAAEYVNGYCGVPRPVGFERWPIDQQHGWILGVDAALALHSDIIARCNEALQQATGAARETWSTPPFGEL